MYDSASIGPVFYRGVLAPVASLIMFAMAIARPLLQFSNQPGDRRDCDFAFLPLVSARQWCLWPRDPCAEPVDARAWQRRDGRVRERVAQVQLIKAFGQEDRESTSVDSASWASYRATLKMLAIFSVIVIVLTPLAGALLIRRLLSFLPGN